MALSVHPAPAGAAHAVDPQGFPEKAFNSKGWERNEVWAQSRGNLTIHGSGTDPLLQWVNGKPGGLTPTRAFRLRLPEAYFFLAARPRPDGAARNEMPVRMAFC